jgi:hypothetical protein
MNQNKLRKALDKAADAYSNLSLYSDTLERSKLIRVSLSHIDNKTEAASQFDQFIREGDVSLPYNNIFFDIRDYPMPNFLTGEHEEQNIGLHLQSVTLEVGEYQLRAMIVLDFRIYEGIPIHKFYIAYADQAGLHLMPMTDLMASQAGCDCHRKNFINNDSKVLEILKSRIPQFDLDAGFALPDCSATNEYCANAVAQKTDMAMLLKVLMGFINLPSNILLKAEKQNSKKPHKYFVLVDEGQMSHLVNGDIAAELSGNSFTDGSKLLTALEDAKAQPPVESFTIDNYEYTVVHDEARERTSGSQEDNG